MKTTLLLLLFPLLLFLVAHADASGETAQGFELKCQEKPVEVQVGENVILNCKSEPQRNLTEEKITWEVNSTIVLNFKDRKMSPDQGEQFKGRAHLVRDRDVSEGKLSVEISSVKENDTGNYTCLVRRVTSKGPKNHMQKCTVTLTVKKENKQTPAGARGDNTPTTIGDSNNCTGTGIGAFIGGLVAALAAWLINRYGKSLLSCKGTQTGVPVPTQDHQDHQGDQDDQDNQDHQDDQDDQDNQDDQDHQDDQDDQDHQDDQDDQEEEEEDAP